MDRQDVKEQADQDRPRQRGKIHRGVAERQPAHRGQHVLGGDADEVPKGALAQVHIANDQVDEQKDRQQILQAEIDPAAYQEALFHHVRLGLGLADDIEVDQQRVEGHPAAMRTQGSRHWTGQGQRPASPKCDRRSLCTGSV